MTLAQNQLIAQQLYDIGFEPIPIAPGQKFPTMKGWQSATLPISWPSPHHGIGLRTGKLVAIDVDVYHEDVVNFLVSSLTDACGNILTRVGQPPKTLVPVHCPKITKKRTSNKWVDENGVINQIEILSHGQQFVAYGIHPDTRAPYQWNGDLLTASLPTISLNFLNELFCLFDLEAKERGWKNITRQVRDAKRVIPKQKQRIDTGTAPGSIYNRAVPITDVLKHYGWKHYRGRYWTRPGKRTGVSGAVLGGIFWPFTSSTILAPDTPYDAFELLAQYEFHGNKSACARALKEAA